MTTLRRCPDDLCAGFDGTDGEFCRECGTRTVVVNASAARTAREGPFMPSAVVSGRPSAPSEPPLTLPNGGPARPAALASADAKMRASEFTIDTRKTPAQVRDIGKWAMGQAHRTLQSSVAEMHVDPEFVIYSVWGPGKIIELARFEVVCTALPDERTRVELNVGTFRTSQMALYGLVPVAPKTAPALRSIRAFSEYMRSELARPF